MRFPLYDPVLVPRSPAYGAFGARRKYDVHTGVDLVVPVGTPVLAIEDGIVVGVEPFTGPLAGCPWWLPTDCVMVEGDSGVIIYGEIETKCEQWEFVEEGSVLGRVLRVLRNDKGKPLSMLHLELYEQGYRAVGSVWPLDGPRPPQLLDPTPMLAGIENEMWRASQRVTCPRCRAALPNRAAMTAHKAVCPRRRGAEAARNKNVQRLREREVCLPPPTACPVCGQRPELVTGAIVYPHRPDLHAKMFWRCPQGCAYVGCHAGTQTPLGVLATEGMRRARIRAHDAFDALWKDGLLTRTNAYRELASRLGIPGAQCHIGQFDEETCGRVVEVCAQIRDGC